MKRNLIASVAAALCLTGQLAQAVTINLTTGNLLDENSNLLADGSTLMLIASTANSSFGNLTSLTLASPTAFVNEVDDVIVARFALDQGTFQPGAHIQSISFNLGDMGIGAADPLLFVWYSGLAENTNPSAPGVGRYFGTFGFPDDVSWVVPGDNSAQIDLNLLTFDAGGGLANNAGLANQITVVPEPSSIALVAIGCVGAILIRRRRK